VNEVGFGSTARRGEGREGGEGGSRRRVSTPPRDETRRLNHSQSDLPKGHRQSLLILPSERVLDVAVGRRSRDEFDEEQQERCESDSFAV